MNSPQTVDDYVWDMGNRMVYAAFRKAVDNKKFSGIHERIAEYEAFYEVFDELGAPDLELPEHLKI